MPFIISITMRLQYVTLYKELLIPQDIIGGVSSRNDSVSLFCNSCIL